MQINVIATFNTVGDVKPVYVSFDGVKSKITRIVNVEKDKGLIRYWCYFDTDDKLILLCFDGAKWWTE